MDQRVTIGDELSTATVIN